MMLKRRKTAFELPYAGIDTDSGYALLYGGRGEVSVIFRIKNPITRYAADAKAYSEYQGLLLNLVKITGEGHIIQKQDIFSRKKYQPSPATEFLQQKYQDDFAGREYTAIVCNCFIPLFKAASNPRK